MASRFRPRAAPRLLPARKATTRRRSCSLRTRWQATLVEILDLAERRDRPARWDPRVRPAPPARRVPRDRRDPPAIPVRRAPAGRLAPQGPRELRVQSAQPGLRATLVPPAPR